MIFFRTGSLFSFALGYQVDQTELLSFSIDGKKHILILFLFIRIYSFKRNHLSTWLIDLFGNVGIGIGWNKNDDGLLSIKPDIYSKRPLLVRSTHARKEENGRSNPEGTLEEK